MKSVMRILAATSALILLFGATVSVSLTQSDRVVSLRGEARLSDVTPAAPVRKQNTSPGRLGRAYRQQPPLIPHNVEKYQLNLKVNQCVQCHDWPNNIEEGAPKISETHYTDRNGVALDHVAGGRWFCTQCHVPQANARPLVKNTFKASVNIK